MHSDSARFGQPWDRYRSPALEMPDRVSSFRHKYGILSCSHNGTFVLCSHHDLFPPFNYLCLPISSLRVFVSIRACLDVPYRSNRQVPFPFIVVRVKYKARALWLWYPGSNTWRWLVCRPGSILQFNKAFSHNTFHRVVYMLYYLSFRQLSSLISGILVLFPLGKPLSMGLLR